MSLCGDDTENRGGCVGQVRRMCAIQSLMRQSVRSDAGRSSRSSRPPRRLASAGPPSASAEMKMMFRHGILCATLALLVADARAQLLDVGKKSFETRCARCHGGDGAGGARAGSLVDRVRPRATTKEAI